MSRLNVLNGWAGINSYFTRRSAQSFFAGSQMSFATSGCGSSCGGDDKKPQSSACGASDEQPKPSACGSSCGTGDK
ncbi:MAG: hypothetical protein AB7V54_05955 [Parabacteroides sp.]|uniref:hypothetical protein n=1 Tax=Macellibacteroides sp. TaxID=2014584 RepID=UPI003E2F2587